MLGRRDVAGVPAARRPRSRRVDLAREGLADAERTDDAIDVLEDVLMVAPLREAVHREFGDRLLAAGRADGAASSISALLAMQPSDLGRCALSAGEGVFRARRPGQEPRASVVCSGNRPALPGSPAVVIGDRTVSEAQNQLETEETRALIETFHGALNISAVRFARSSSARTRSSSTCCSRCSSAATA